MKIALVRTKSGENTAQVVKDNYQGEQNVGWIDWVPDHFVDCLSQPDALSSVDAILFVLTKDDIDQQQVEKADDYAESRSANSFIWLKQEGSRHCPKHGRLIECSSAGEGEESTLGWLAELNILLEDLPEGKKALPEEDIRTIKKIESIVNQCISTLGFATATDVDQFRKSIEEQIKPIETRISNLEQVTQSIDAAQDMQNSNEEIKKCIKTINNCINDMEAKAKPNNGWSSIALAIAGVSLYAMIVYDKLANPNDMNLGITITIAVCGTVLLMAAVCLYVATRKHYFRVLSERQDELICIDVISGIDDVTVRNAMCERFVEAKLKNKADDL